ncbi:hypothetical protein BN2476_1610005 [Paraburkholderia piptadeniae]|uniref:Uncharacterized protein n=1 Tax=Paraburkholderia piptadeniae TaxID=1701573 RepID=A0A1N7SYF3_9BURK|nr:hypothetical protein BN2476_1610005 [Paraburkholderia piptadeniae]
MLTSIYAFRIIEHTLAITRFMTKSPTERGSSIPTLAGFAVAERRHQLSGGKWASSLAVQQQSCNATAGRSG